MEILNWKNERNILWGLLGGIEGRENLRREKGKEKEKRKGDLKREEIREILKKVKDRKVMGVNGVPGEA